MGADEEVDHGDFDRRLAADELSIGVLRLASKADPERWEASRSTRRLIARTKEFLEATFADPIRLADIAQQVIDTRSTH